jgi:hypothetical protein
MTLTVTEAGLALADPVAYADEARLNEALTLLRRKAPVHLVRAPGFEPFWAITRHGDIMEIERQNSLFLNAPRPLLAPVEMDAIAKQREAEGTALRTPHLESVELAGQPEWVATTFVGGLKHLPIRYTLRDRADPPA